MAFGAQIIRAQELMHGKVSKIFHDSSGIFKDLKQGFEATRYHSLVIDESTLAEELTINARTEDKTIMSISHKEYPLFGLQFHPESLLTESGIQILENYLSI